MNEQGHITHPRPSSISTTVVSGSLVITALTSCGDIWVYQGGKWEKIPELPGVFVPAQEWKPLPSG